MEERRGGQSPVLPAKCQARIVRNPGSPSQEARPRTGDEAGYATCRLPILMGTERRILICLASAVQMGRTPKVTFCPSDGKKLVDLQHNER